ACYSPGNKPAPTTLESFAKSIAFDNEDNLYIATVSGNVFRHDGQSLSRLISKGTAGLDIAEGVRYSQGTVYVHNKRYETAQLSYVDEILRFTTDGEFIGMLVNETDIKAKNFINVSANAEAQIFSLTDADTARILRINRDKLNLSDFDLASDPEFNQLLDQLMGLTDSTSTDQALPAPEETDTMILIQEHLGEDVITEIQNTDAQTTDTATNGLTALFATPTGLTTDNSDGLYVSFFHGIYKFTTHGNFIRTVIKMGEHGFEMTNKMAVDPYGNLVVANIIATEESTTINFLKFDADGNYQGVFIPTGAGGLTNRVHDIAFDHAGNFYVVDMIKGVYKFDATGQFDSLLVKTYDR
ncbi:MAG: hypothetical protein OEY00_09655, partial [Gammaproteobacteria bacterium]|nr:hypothetical protein [Gammaproteobacteria bacterium]